MSALKLLKEANLRYRPAVDNTKLPCYTLPLTQNQFLKKLTPLFSDKDLSIDEVSKDLSIDEVS